MKGPLWFDADGNTCDAIERLNKKRIWARAVLPNGWVLEGVGDTWTYVNGSRSQAALTVVFEYESEPYVMTQTRIYLTAEQYRRIGATSRQDAELEFPGDLRPPLISVPKT